MLNIIYILISIIIGCCVGIITGLTPGIHINLISALVISYSLYLTKLFPPELISVAVISMSITHTFLDIIPTTFLGVNSDDNLASVFPSHKLVLEGKGLVSIKLSCIGCFIGLVFVIISTPILIYAVPKLYPLIKSYIPYILIVLSLVIIYTSTSIIKSLIIFTLSGILGLITLGSSHLSQPLLPLLSGLFGISSLVLSIKNNTKIPEQDSNVKLDVNKSRIIKNISLSLLCSTLISFLPALTSSHTTKIVSWIKKELSGEDYILINNSVNTIAMFLSIIALYSIDKARNGPIVAISQILEMNLSNLILLIVCSLISSFIAIFLTLKLSLLISKIIPKINYKKICISIIILVIFITLVISGALGFLVLMTAISIGIIAQLTNTERINLIGCLILPVVLYITL